MYLLDTNVVSELRRIRPHGAVVAWLEATDNKYLHIGAPTIGEIQNGVERTRRQDEEKAAAIESWLDAVILNYSVLPMDAEAFRLHAKLMVGRPDEAYEDAMIAAIASSHGLTVATRNVRDFAPFGVKTLNPFK